MVEALEGDVAAVGDQGAHRLAAARREAAAVGAVQVEAGQRDAPGGDKQVTVCRHHARRAGSIAHVCTCLQPALSTVGNGKQSHSK